MKVLVVGGGGREHALVRKIRESPRVRQVFCAPGNAGIAREAKLVPIPAEDVKGLLSFAKEEEIDLTVVGPEAPLCAGIVDLFTAEHLRIFGPTKAAAELEGSKAFAKSLMQKHLVPTATFRNFRDSEDARAYLHTVLDWPVVLKADGLAAGKGVIVAKSLAEADEVIEEMMERRAFGEAGRRVVVEEFLAGEEASIIAFIDGGTIAVLEASQDHKAALDGDRGPNTGGMGAYSPAPVVTDRVLDQVVRDILVPIVHALHVENRDYRGILYAGLMIGKGGPKVLEFNVRLGDPETQALLPRLKTDLVEMMEATIDGTLDRVELRWDPRAALCVVMASGGYPGRYEKGRTISGLDEAEALDGVHVFHAGTEAAGGRTVTAGGRVLGVTALGADLADAQARAYAAVGKIRFEGAHYRRDIGHRAVKAVSP
ncbi:MAG: phosphoribosylamine--glycine ligase [Planctomycetes bacterium]|jgi:phosphoribosylamine--glycine ligase|nr:phosphoribosylamine--glycine ligase [Planctomycetota bacterium]